MITIKYFASIREKMGLSQETFVGHASTLGDLRDQLIGRGGAYAENLARGSAVRMALNQVMCDDSAVLTETAEVAFFPPVTGG